MEKFVSDGSDADNVPGTKRLTGTCYLMIGTTYDYKNKIFYENRRGKLDKDQSLSAGCQEFKSS